MDRVLLEATGTFGQGRIDLLDDAVRFVRGKAITTIPLSDISGIYFKPAGALRNGSLSLAVDPAKRDSGDRSELSVHFVRRQQKAFEAIKLLIESKTGLTAQEERRLTPAAGMEYAELEDADDEGDIQDGEPIAPAAQADPVLVAVGTFGQGKIQLLGDRVRILRGREPIEVPLDQLVDLRFEGGTALRNGSLVLIASGQEPVTFKFVRRQQGDVEAVRDALQERTGLTVRPLREPEAEDAATEPEAVLPEPPAPDPEPEPPIPAPPTPEPPAPEPPAPFVPSVALARFVVMGARARTLLDDLDARSDEATGALLDALSIEIEALRGVEAPETYDAVSTYLMNGIQTLAVRAEDAEVAASQAFGTGRKARAVMDHVCEQALQAAGAGSAAAALATVIAEQAYSPAALTVYEGLNYLNASVQAVGADSARPNAEVIEPIFPDLVSRLGELKSRIDARGAAPDAAPVSTLLSFATEYWQTSLDALNAARGDYIRGRDRWSTWSRRVSDGLQNALLFLAAGNCLVAVSDLPDITSALAESQSISV